MGNYERLKEAIKAVVKTNGKQEITGQVMQDALLAITSSFGQGALFAGIATPETNPLTPDQNVFYLASQSGVYPNFNSLSVNEDEIVVFSLSNGQWTKQLLSLGGGGSVTIVNEPDEEDLTTVPQTADKNVIRFKNRLYDEANASGKGYKILRKYWKEVNGVRKNILTQDMINDANTIYEIRYDFDLNGAEIQIKEGCVLNFVGGSLNNGTINFNNAKIISVGNNVLNDISLKGNYNGDFNVKWFNIDETKSCTLYLQNAINIIQGTKNTLYIPNGVYLLTPQENAGIKYHLLISDSITVIGEDKYKTILRRVLPDLSNPQQANYGDNNEYGHLIEIKSTPQSEKFNLYFKGMTLDGNQNWEHLKWGNLKDKLIHINGDRIVDRLDYINLNCINNASEACYNVAYRNNTVTRFINCTFKNNGGSSGNSGGDDVIYNNCEFINANIEHSWSPYGQDGTLIVENCSFKNRFDNFLSSNFQLDRPDTFSKNKKVLIRNNIFYIESQYYENYVQHFEKVGNKVIIVSQAELVNINNNYFYNVGFNTNYGGSIISEDIQYKFVKECNFYNNNIIGDSAIVLARETLIKFYNNTFSSIFIKNRANLYEYNNMILRTIKDASISSEFKVNLKKEQLYSIAIGVKEVKANLNVTVLIIRQSTGKTVFNKILPFSDNKKNIVNIKTLDDASAYIIRTIANIQTSLEITVHEDVYEGSDYLTTTCEGLTKYRDKEFFVWDGAKWVVVLNINNKIGETNQRPQNIPIGFQYYDTTLKKYIVWNGTEWTNMDGTTL